MKISQIYDVHKSIKSISYNEALRVLNYLGVLYKGRKGLAGLRPEETYDFLRWSYDTHGVIIEIQEGDHIQVKVVAGQPPELGGLIIDSEFYN